MVPKARFRHAGPLPVDLVCREDVMFPPGAQNEAQRTYWELGSGGCCVAALAVRGYHV